MRDHNTFDVLIIGGSYSGLAAGMALGRAMKRTLIIDDGKPCNRQTPYSHNFLTNDGKTPAEILSQAHAQVMCYDTIQFFQGRAITGRKTDSGFEIEVATGQVFSGKKLIFATGIKDILPDIDGTADCWGVSVLHCPYCHGYEVRAKPTGILSNGDVGFEFTTLILNWTRNLTLFTNGTSTLTTAQTNHLLAHGVRIVENEIAVFEHSNGNIRNVVFKNDHSNSIDIMYAPSPFEQHCKIPESLGCELTEEGYIKVDSFNETSVNGVYAIGDNSAKMRTVANAVAAGTAAGMMISKKMILADA